MKEQKELMAIYEKEHPRLLKIPGVTGTDIGFKYVNGERTEEVVIRVFVAEKKSDVPEENFIPEEINGIKTDVIQAVFEHHSALVSEENTSLASSITVDYSNHKTIIGGISVGPERTLEDDIVMSGTLGCPVQEVANPGRPLIMSNYHVLCVDNDWSKSPGVVQPSRADGGSTSDDHIGNVITGVCSDTVDGAVSTSDERPVYPYITEIGAIRGTDVAFIGMEVRKRGRTTGLTYGIVDGVNASIKNLETGHLFTNQISVHVDQTKCHRMSGGGDSGSVYVNNDNEVVGLHWGGSDDGVHAVGNNIADVENALNVQVYSVAEANPITDVTVILDSDPVPNGYTKIPFDLNKKVGGKYIYLCYKRGGGTPITDLYVIAGGSSGISAPAGFTKVDVDLNKGAGGDYIYLCYKKGGDNPPIMDVNVVQASNTEDISPPPGWTKIGMNLNKGAGGYFQYITYRWSDQLPITALNVICDSSSNVEPDPEWARLPGDTNESVGGKYIYLAYNKKTNQEPITRLEIIYNKEVPPTGYSKINVDLNKGAGGAYVYVCYSTSTKYKAKSIKDMSIVYGKNNASAPAEYVRIPKDMNKGAGGEFGFLCYRKET